jgi:hypothetical protein
MCAYPLSNQRIVEFPLDAVDAALKLICLDRLDLWHKRLEELPGMLVIYCIADERREKCLGNCGEIRLQYYSLNQVRLSIETDQCADEDILRYHSYPRGRVIVRLILAEGDPEIRRGREALLTDLCDQLLANLSTARPLLPGTPKPVPGQAGKPPLSEEEVILRIALALLEKQLKGQDLGMTRGEVVVLARERLGILTTINNIKDGKNRLGDADWKGNEALLNSAQELENTWLSRLAS